MIDHHPRPYNPNNDKRIMFHQESSLSSSSSSSFSSIAVDDYRDFARLYRQGLELQHNVVSSTATGTSDRACCCSCGGRTHDSSEMDDEVLLYASAAETTTACREMTIPDPRCSQHTTQDPLSDSSERVAHTPSSSCSSSSSAPAPAPAPATTQTDDAVRNNKNDNATKNSTQHRGPPMYMNKLRKMQQTIVELTRLETELPSKAPLLRKRRRRYEREVEAITIWYQQIPSV